MAAEPGDRYPTARELAEDLHRFEAGQLVGAHSYGAIKSILRQGLDLEPLSPALATTPTPQLASPRFARSMSELLHHITKKETDDEHN